MFMYDHAQNWSIQYTLYNLVLNNLMVFNLTLTRTLLFHGSLQVAIPHAIFPLTEIELWDRYQTNPWDVLSLMVLDLNSLDHILSLDPSRSGQRKKDSELRSYISSQITFKLRKIAE